MESPMGISKKRPSGVAKNNNRTNRNVALKRRKEIAVVALGQLGQGRRNGGAHAGTGGAVRAVQ